jgi:hypothetical protein
MDITKLTGEQLAEMISEQYELSTKIQNNLRLLKEELVKRINRKEIVPKKVKVVEEERKSND